MSVIHESAENYLESILMLSKKLPVVRSIDVANELGFKKSSVSIAMKNLRESNHITVTKEGYIYLTESGKEIAEMIYERHQLLTSWLIRLGVDPKVAEEDACRIEHEISKESFNAIKKAISYFFSYNFLLGKSHAGLSGMALSILHILFIQQIPVPSNLYIDHCLVPHYIQAPFLYTPYLIY